MQVDLLRRHSFPVYWNGDNRRALRGHCFARKGSLDWFHSRRILLSSWSLLIAIVYCWAVGVCLSQSCKCYIKINSNMVAFCETVSFVPNVNYWFACLVMCLTFIRSRFQPSRLFVALVDMQGSAPVCWFLMLNLYLGHLILLSFMLALSTLLVSCRGC